MAIDRNGYRRFKRNGKMVYEHRWLMEQAMGRKLDLEEVVHHINGNKFDNRIENLEIMSRTSHNRHHSNVKSKCVTACYSCPYYKAHKKE